VAGSREWAGSRPPGCRLDSNVLSLHSTSTVQRIVVVNDSINSTDSEDASELSLSLDDNTRWRSRGQEVSMAGLVNFEDEQEVKQFLDNLAVEYSFQCYQEKQPDGRTTAS